MFISLHQHYEVATGYLCACLGGSSDVKGHISYLVLLYLVVRYCLLLDPHYLMILH